jgi:hypothetical protein
MLASYECRAGMIVLSPDDDAGLALLSICSQPDLFFEPDECLRSVSGSAATDTPPREKAPEKEFPLSRHEDSLQAAIDFGAGATTTLPRAGTNLKATDLGATGVDRIPSPLQGWRRLAIAQTLLRPSPLPDRLLDPPRVSA